MIRKASPQVEPDLFWALTGGGGAFGVATAFEYAFDPIGRVSQGSIVLPATREIVEALVPLGLAAPEELTIIPLVVPGCHRCPGLPRISWGRWSCSSSSSIPARRRVRPGLSRRSATWVGVLLDTVAVKPYPDVYPPSGTDPWGIASEAMFIDRLDREIADIVLRRIESANAAEAMVQLRVFGGAFARARLTVRRHSGTAADPPSCGCSRRTGISSMEPSTTPGHDRSGISSPRRHEAPT